MSSYGLWLSAGGMKVNEHRQTLLANNMANSLTAGFKHDLAVVMQRGVESESAPNGFGFRHPVLDAMTGGLNVRQPVYSSSQGSIESTGRPLDVAIEGEGFFTVSDGKQTRYTRNGEFTRNAAGELVLSSGGGRWRVLSREGGPIVLDETGGEIKVSGNGTVRQGENVVGQFALRKPVDPGVLKKSGENLFEAGGPQESMVEATPRLVSESVEQSTFDSVVGLAEMIEATRAYTLNATLIQMQDQATGLSVGTVGRVA